MRPQRSRDTLLISNVSRKDFRKNCGEAKEAFKEISDKASRLKWTATKRKCEKPDGAMNMVKQLCKDADMMQCLFACCADKTPDDCAM